MEFVEDNDGGDTFTYTITLGNAPVIVLPAGVQALHETVMMFGIAPDNFYTLGEDDHIWYFIENTDFDYFVTILQDNGWFLCQLGYCNCYEWEVGFFNTVVTSVAQDGDMMYVWVQYEDGSGKQVYLYNSDHPMMMFGIAPYEFDDKETQIFWEFLCNGITEGDTIVEIAKAVLTGYTGEKVDQYSGYSQNAVTIWYLKDSDTYKIQFNDNNVTSDSYYYWLSKTA